jgi:hypothetical protein
MARKIIDTYPQFTVSVGAPKRGSQIMTREQAEEAQAEFAELLDALQSATLRQFDVESKLVEDVRCEFCNATWLGGDIWNLDCCGKDAASSPVRLSELVEAAEEVENDDLYTRDEDGKPSRVPIDWASTLGGAAARWLKAGRPADGVAALMPLIQRVKSTDWCTVWKDPGVSGASLARLPDEIRRDYRPERLADELLSLIDDMDLLPARRAA